MSRGQGSSGAATAARLRRYSGFRVPGRRRVERGRVGRREKRPGFISLPPTFYVLLFSLALGALPSALGQPLSDLQQQAQQNRALQQQQQARINQLNRDLANLDAATAQQLAQLRGLEAQITKLEREKAELTAQINVLDGQRKDAEARIASLEQQLGGLKARLSAMLLSLHREKAGRYLPLLRSQSFTDLAVRTQWVRTLGQHQTDLMNQITTTVTELNDQRTRLQLLVKDLGDKRQARTERITALNANRQTVRVTLASLKQQKAGRQVILRETLVAQAQLRTDLQALQGRITAELRRIEEERRRAEEARRQAELRRQQQQQANARPAPNTGALPDVPRALVGSLKFPVQGGRIAQAYGCCDNDWQTIQGSEGSSLVAAAADGVVLDSLFIANLGWTITIRHSEQVATQYVNLSEPRVSVGDRVYQGQIIGNTGGGVLIPNNEMWFRVIVIGGDGFRYVDPSRYY